jgi:ribonuclease P protein component
LKSSRDFQSMYRSGHKCTGKYFFSFLHQRNDPDTRFGVTASRRIGNAVVRNRAKRIMREAIRRVVIETQPGFDLILVARSSIRSVGTNELIPQLKDHLFNCHGIRVRRGEQF